MKQQTSTIEQSELAQVLGKYRPLGVLMGRELCLRPDEALLLVNDLEAIGVPIMGLDGWCYANPEHRVNGWLMQDLDTDLYVGDTVLRGNNRAHESARIVREYLLHHLLERTEYVSFTLDVPVEWELFGE